MTPIDLVILGLACWRLSHLFSRESGPGAVCERLRSLLGVRYLATTGTYTASTFFGQIVACPLCLSVWVATAMVALWLLVPVSYWIFVVLAISAISSLLELFSSR